MKDFTEYLNENVRSELLEYSGHRLVFPLKMKNGLVMSVQASTTHYCEPRSTTEVPNYNWYETFEIGFPSQKVEKLLPYAEEPESPTDTVYAYVPKALVREVIADAGGVIGVVKEGEE